MIKQEELLDLPLREVLENYCTVCNLECGYYYGIFRFDDVEQIIEEYNIEEEYSEAFQVESILVCEDLIGWDIKDYENLINIMENLGVNHK